MSNPKGSGDGTRPTTDGGTDNIGAGEKFAATKNAVGEDVSGPAPKERMLDKKSNAEAARHDESAAFGLHEDLTPASSKDDNRR
ncbi:hypothetical protein ACSFA0_18470 [Variovorax sp. LT1P1]|uniref:hypothetical protein n=1 Tax=Variovorax sp. LT1P1 TaxID=3443730 RepID=UPI003F459512